MPALIPIAARIGQQILPVVLNELSKPRTRRFIRQGITSIRESFIERGKRAQVAPVRLRKPRDVIITRGRQKFKCRRMR